jgi:2-deoxy-D-gluconate 3-dehydrogenase
VLDGKVAVVTGAGRGIGRALALALAGAGADLVLTARSEDQLNLVAKEVRAEGRRAAVVPCDITDEAAVDHLADRAAGAFGRLDILVNNSGILATRTLLDTEAGEWDRLYAVNVRGTFLVTRAIGRHLVAQGHGKVIMVGSNFAVKGVPLHTAYCSTKAAVAAFSKALAQEWARYNVQVNVLAPGYVETDFNADARADPDVYQRILKGVPARRMGRPEELGSWVVQLAGPASDFMTGSVVLIDGGQTA